MGNTYPNRTKSRDLNYGCKVSEYKKAFVILHKVYSFDVTILEALPWGFHGALGKGAVCLEPKRPTG